MYGKFECVVIHMFYVCVLSASCGSSQCILHDLQFVNAGSRIQEATIWKSHNPEPVS